MLKIFRNISNNWLFKSVLAIIVFSFIGFGVGGRKKDNLPSVITFSDGSSVNYLEFLQAKKQKQTYIQQIAPGAVKDIDVLVIDDLIREKIMQDLARDYHLALDSEVLKNYITNSPYFKNEQGQFDDRLFHAFLQQSKLSQSEYLAMIKKDLEHHLVTSAVFSGIYIAPEFSQQISKLAREVRAVKLARLDMTTSKQSFQVEEQSLRLYYEQHPHQFMIPELHSIEYMVLTTKNPKLKVEVTKAEIDEAINGDEQTLPKTEHRAQIAAQKKSQKLAILVQETIAKMEDELAGGTSLSALAKEYNLPLLKIEKTSIHEIIKKEPKLKHLQLEQYAVDREPHIWHLTETEEIIISRVIDVIPSTVAPFEQVKNQVKKHYLQAQIKAANIAKMEDCAKNIKADNFKTIATKHGLEVITKNIMRSNSKDSKLPPKLLQHILTADVQQISPVSYDERYAYIAILEKIAYNPLKEKEESQLDAIAVKDAIINSYMQQLDNHYVKKLDVKVTMPN